MSKVRRGKEATVRICANGADPSRLGQHLAMTKATRIPPAHRRRAIEVITALQTQEWRAS